MRSRTDSGGTPPVIYLQLESIKNREAVILTTSLSLSVSIRYMIHRDYADALEDSSALEAVADSVALLSVFDDSSFSVLSVLLSFEE